MGRFLDMIRGTSLDNVESNKLSASAQQAKEAKEDNRGQTEALTADAPEILSEPENSWEWIEERAAILEIDGGNDRHTANYRAFVMWFEQFVEGVGKTETVENG